MMKKLDLNFSRYYNCPNCGRKLRKQNGFLSKTVFYVCRICDMSWNSDELQEEWTQVGPTHEK